MNPNEELNEIDPGIERLLDLLKTFPERDSAKVQLGRTKFIAELDRLFPVHSANGHHAPRSAIVEPVRRRSPTITLFNRRLSLAWAAAALLTLFFLVTTGVMTAQAAEGALPGDALYAVKTGLEQARLAVTTNPDKRLDLYLRYADRRLKEADELLEAGRFTDVARVVGELEANVRSADVTLQSVVRRDPSRGRDLKTDMVVRLSGFSVIVNSLSATAPPTLQPVLQSSLASIEEIIVDDAERPGSDLPASSGGSPQDNSSAGGQPPNSGDLPGNRPPAGPGSNDPPPANDPGENVPPDGDGGSRVNPGSGSANSNDGNGGRNNPNNGSNPGSDSNTNDGGSSSETNNPAPGDQGNGGSSADDLSNQSNNSNADDSDANSNAASDGDSESLASNANDAADTPADNPDMNANDSSPEDADDPGANHNDADDAGPTDPPPADDQPGEPGEPDPGADCADENGDGRCDEMADPAGGGTDGDQPWDNADRNRGNTDAIGGRTPADGGSSDDSGGSPPADDGGGEANNPADDSGSVDDGNPAPNSNSKTREDGAPIKANVDSEKKSTLESSRTP